MTQFLLTATAAGTPNATLPAAGGTPLTIDGGGAGGVAYAEYIVLDVAVRFKWCWAASASAARTVFDSGTGYEVWEPGRGPIGHRGYTGRYLCLEAASGGAVANAVNSHPEAYA